VDQFFYAMHDYPEKIERLWRPTISGSGRSPRMDSATEAQFRDFIDGLVERYARQPRFVLGVSDMVTADAEWDRLLYVTDKVARIGLPA
jgi:hypothetical protein